MSKQIFAYISADDDPEGYFAWCAQAQDAGRRIFRACAEAFPNPKISVYDFLVGSSGVFTCNFDAADLAAAVERLQREGCATVQEMRFSKSLDGFAAFLRVA